MCRCEHTRELVGVFFFFFFGGDDGTKVLCGHENNKDTSGSEQTELFYIHQIGKTILTVNYI